MVELTVKFSIWFRKLLFHSIVVLHQGLISDLNELLAGHFIVMQTAHLFAQSFRNN